MVERIPFHNLDTEGHPTGDVAQVAGGKMVLGPVPTSSVGITVQDENGTVATDVMQLDFHGAGVTAVPGTGEVVITIPGSTGGSGSGEDLVPLTTVIAGVPEFVFDEDGQEVLTAYPGGGTGVAGGTVDSIVAGTGIAVDSTDPANPVVSTTGTGTTTRTINARTASYALALVDAGAFVTIDAAGATTLTVPTNASVAFPVGTSLDGAQLGTGQVTIVGASGVVVVGDPGLKVAARYGVFGLLKIATDTWLAYGRLAA